MSSDVRRQPASRRRLYDRRGEPPQRHCPAQGTAGSAEPARRHPDADPRSRPADPLRVPHGTRRSVAVSVGGGADPQHRGARRRSTGRFDPALRRDVERRRVTALLVGLGDLFDEPPPALVRACLELDLPLLAQHAAVPFRRIVDWADSLRIADREVGTRERDLGSLLRWFVAGTLGVGPVETALAECGLADSPVAVCAFTADVHTRVHELVDRYRGRVALLDDRIVALCPQTEQFAAELTASDLVCGVAIAPDAGSMVYAIPEALEALREGIRWRRSVHIEEIATLDGLLAAVPKVRLVPFVHRLLVPLVDHDKLNNAYLVSSLEAFLAPGTDISTAAGQLYVHVNTLRNRLAKIAELTGANPLDETDRTNFRIALWAAGTWEWAAAHRRQNRARSRCSAM